MKKDPKARDALIEQHIPYVRKLAAKVRRDIRADSFELDELIAYGSRGLVEAADRFDPTRGVAFTTFSYYRIRGAIFDGLRKTGWLNRTEYARYQAASNDYLGNSAAREQPGATQSATTEETAAEVASTLDNLATIFVTSLDADPRGEVADTKAVGADDEAALKEHTGLLHQAIRTLPERERTIIELYYFKEMTLEQIGERLGSSKSWTSRLHARAIQALTAAMAPCF